MGRYFGRVLYNEILDESFRLQWQNRTFNFSPDGLLRNGQSTIVWNDAYLGAARLDSLIAAGMAPDPKIFADEKQAWYGPLSYIGNIQAPGQPPNDAFGKPTQLIEPERRLRLGAGGQALIARHPSWLKDTQARSWALAAGVSEWRQSRGFLRVRAGLLPTLALVLLAPAGITMAANQVPDVLVERSRSVAPDRDADPVLNNLERRTFRYFWNTANKTNGMVPDRYPTPSFASIAAVGFGLTAYVAGAERGYVSRAQARLRVLRTLRFLEQLPQGPDETGTAGYKGFFYHFLYMQNGLRFGTSELSTVDTALLLGGVLLCQSYFDRDTRAENEIRDLAERIYGRVDWNWAQNRPPAVSHGWRPETGFLRFDWRGYNEAMLMYILALGSPTHPVEPAAWQQWTQTYKHSWGKFSGQEFLSFGPQFGHQYSHVWIDFRGIQDEFMRSKGIDYFENSRRAAYAQRTYATENPMRWRGYDSEIWGLSASDGPADTVQIFNNEERGFFSYSARGTASPHILDDGTIAPTASVGSIAFAPEIVIPTIRAFRARFGEALYQRYGFLDAVNPSFTFTDVPLRHGRIVENIGWVADDYLGIDQGPIVAMIENYRSEVIWKTMQRNPHIRRGLTRAGFTGGWLSQPPAAQETNVER